VPLVGVSSLDAMARNAPPGRVVACVRNARRGALYAGIYGPDRSRREDLALLPVERARSVLPAGALLIGDATDSHREFLSGDGREFGGADDGEARALVVASLGRALAGAGRTVTPADLAPIYLRASEAEERLARRGDR
jgi:tRNA A37 threonylcarbamoyladenosine modification protein TsaB